MTHARPPTGEPAESEDLFPANPPLLAPDARPRHAAAGGPASEQGEERDGTANRLNPVLSLDGVTIAYPRPGQGELTIVSDLCLHVGRGEFACVAGRSGSGKTSVLRAAGGLSTPTRGSVRWQGVDIAGLAPDELATSRRGLCGILDQNAALLPELSALENVLLAAVPDRRVKQLRPRAEELLDGFGLGTRARHRPDALSGGERQRVGLARAMLLDSPVLVVDEPTASLDRAWADTIIEFLVAATERGTAVLAASHDPHLTDAAQVAVALD